jgi:hypothetical protein
MKANYLFPHRMKWVGWFLLIPGIVVGLLVMIFQVDAPVFFHRSVFAIADIFPFSDNVWFGMTTNNVLDEIVALMVISGSIFIAFSKEKTEDEFISKIRMESLIWATYVNYGILVLAILLFYSFAFLQVMVLNMFTILIFFLIRFHWALRKNKKMIDYEK